MSFREKSAWITLVSVFLSFGAFYGAIGLGWIPSHGFLAVHVLLACVGVLIALQVGLRWLFASLSPAEARTPKDEREVLIELRATRIGYFVMMIGVVGCGLSLHLGRISAFDLMSLVLLMVVIAVLVTTVAQIVQYRRGA